jgi:hypothetical protein
VASDISINHTDPERYFIVVWKETKRDVRVFSLRNKNQPNEETVNFLVRLISDSEGLIEELKDNTTK